MAYKDLLKDVSESKDDGNYFLITITDLDLGTAYPLEFRWKNKDGTFGSWSAVKTFTTQYATAPDTPEFLVTNVTGGAGAITVEWNGKNTAGTDLSNIDRIEVWISEPPFDSTKPAYSSKTKFKTQLQAPAGTYTVALYAVTVNGVYSSVSSAYAVNVTAIAPPVSPPTLPSGLSVATAPFAVSVNWAGAYSSSNFDGFKSIDIHVRGSDVGSTATSGFSTATQVATLTVNSTTNRQNISLDNLRQALNLANNTAAYTAPMFFYYIAKNTNDAVYSVSGTPTYTRINSSSVNPTQANFVDLANGVISIENLVAGNGNFASYLRVGSSATAGGSRIELSGVNDFTDSNTTRTVKRGLTAYDSGNNEVLRFDYGAATPTLSIIGNGTFTGNLSIGTGNSIFKAEPATGIWLGNSTYGSAPFRVSTNGALFAESGDIAGWQINPSFLQNTSGTFKISSTNADPQIQVGASAGGHIRISAGTGIAHYSSGTTLSNLFTLSPTGTSTISGWTIGTGQISKGSTILDASSTNGFFQIGSGSSFFKVSTSGIQLGNETFGSAPFRVTAAGALTATNADITGAITATSGTFAGSLSSATGSFSSGSIGGLTVNANTLSYGGMTIFTSEAGFGLNYSIYDTGKGIRTQYLTVGDSSNNGTYSYPLSSSSLNVFDKATFYNTVDVSGTGSLTLGSGSVGTNGNVYTSNSSGTAASTTNGAYLSSSGYVLGRRSSGSPLIAHRTDSNGNIIQFLFSGSAGGFITGSTSVTPSFTGTSDYRAKKNIENYSGALDLIKQTSPRQFIMKNDPLEKIQVGFIAHEFAEVFPDFVFGEKDALDEDGNPDYQTLSTTNLIPYLMAAVKELAQKLDALEG